MMSLRFVAPDEWPALASRFRDLTFEQTLAYALSAAARIGGEARFVAIEEDGRLVAAACARIKVLPILNRGIAWIASGPLTLLRDAPTPDDAALKRILLALREQFVLREGHTLRLRLPGIAFVDTELFASAAAMAGFIVATRGASYQSIAIDLHKTVEQLEAALDRKWRASLRFAAKQGLSIDRGNTPVLQARFIALFKSVQSAKGFQIDIGPEFHFAIAGSGYDLTILVATQEGQDLAGIVIATVGNSVVYLFGATAEAGREKNAGYFLTWEGIGNSLGRGLDWYDMGGIDMTANPDVYRFKNRLNGRHFLATPFEARCPGPVGALISGLERLRDRAKRS